MAGTDADGAVDLQAIIAAFLADESLQTLELPTGLTAEQRKEAKRLVDLQSEMLKCESYGFGEERRLHIFKKGKDRLRVKNTFIDGWEGEQSSEAPAFRSMPANQPQNLLERTLQRCMGGSDGSRSLGGLASVADASPSGASTAVELPPLPEGFQIRNTFIHIESVPVVERIVQSMPHGMFSACLQEELQAQAPSSGSAQPRPSAPPSAPPTAAAPAVIASSADEQVLLPGTEVIIQGLIKLPDFNGLSGVVQSLDPETGRYDVLLDGPAGQCGWRWVKVKGENCRLCMPPPPRNAPTLSMDCEEGQEGQETTATPTWEDESGAKASQTLKLNGLV